MLNLLIDEYEGVTGDKVSIGDSAYQSLWFMAFAAESAGGIIPYITARYTPQLIARDMVLAYCGYAKKPHEYAPPGAYEAIEHIIDIECTTKP